MVRIELLEKAFIFEAKRRGDIDLSINAFESSLKRLSGAFINISAYQSSKWCDFLNPSVKDCVSKHMYFDENSSFLFFEQYLFAYGGDNFLKSKVLLNTIKKNELSSYMSQQYSQADMAALFFASNSFLDSSFDWLFFKAVSSDMHNAYWKKYNHYNKELFNKLVSDEYLSFYNLSKLDDEELLSFVLNCIACAEPSNLPGLFRNIETKRILETLQNSEVKEAIIDYCYSGYDRSSAISHGILVCPDGSKDFDEDAAKEYAVNDVYDEINETFNNLVSDYSLFIDENDISDYIDGSDFFDEYNSQGRDYDSEDYYGYSSDDDSCYQIFDNLLR